jgi:hypothetical protein
MKPDDPTNKAQASSSSKVFCVIVMNCKNEPHARKIADLLHASFPHRAYATAGGPSIGFTIMVEADSLASIQTVISPALGKAQAAFASDWVWLSEKGEMSVEPPAHAQFAPPTRLRSAAPQG